MDTQDIEELKKQNTELLLALREAATALENSQPIMHHYIEPNQRHNKAYLAVLDAIAAAETSAAQSAPASSPEAGPDTKLLVDVATSVVDKWMMLDGYDEDETKRFCEQMQAAFDHALADRTAAANADARTAYSADQTLRQLAYMLNVDPDKRATDAMTRAVRNLQVRLRDDRTAAVGAVGKDGAA